MATVQPNKKVSEEASAGTIVGTDLFRLVQGLGTAPSPWVSKKATLDQLAAYFGSGGGVVVRSIVPGTGMTVDNTDPAHPIIATSGGGGAVGETLSQLLVNALIAAPTKTIASGSTGAVYDMLLHTVIGGIDYYVFVYGGMCAGTTMRTATTAQLVIPAGKSAYAYGSTYDAQTSNNWTFYKADLFNVTAAASKMGPPSSGALVIASNTNAFVNPYVPAPYFPSIANATLTVPITVTSPVSKIAVAGDTLKSRIGGGSDSNTRSTFSAFAIAVY